MPGLPDFPTEEFADRSREVHALGAGGSFGVLTAFLWVQYSVHIGFVFGLVFLSVVTGIRLTRLLQASTNMDVAVKHWVANPTNLIQQVRAEGAYTVTAFTVAAAVTYVVLPL